jgi:large subunit ribosomal protein L22
MAQDSKTFRAVHKWARIMPRKARLIATLVRGMPVNDALAILNNSPQRAAKLFHKVVKSALANASNDVDIDLNALVLAESRVDAGPLLGGRQRWRPRAMGRATPIRKRTSHLRIGLAEAGAEAQNDKRAGKRAGKKVAAPKAAAPEAAPAETAEE